jgi:hypothetical protein
VRDCVDSTKAWVELGRNNIFVGLRCSNPTYVSGLFVRDGSSVGWVKEQRDVPVNLPKAIYRFWPLFFSVVSWFPA